MHACTCMCECVSGCDVSTSVCVFVWACVCELVLHARPNACAFRLCCVYVPDSVVYICVIVYIYVCLHLTQFCWIRVYLLRYVC